MAVVSPERWAPWVYQAIPKKNNMMNMGLVEEIRNMPIAEGGKFFKKPYRLNMTNIGDLEQVTATTTLTVNTVGDIEENVVVCRAGIAYGDVTVNDIIRGIESNNVFSQEMAKYFADQLQDYLVAMATGVFGAISSTHQFDATATSDQYFSLDNTVKTRLLLGEVFDEYTIMVVPSVILGDMINASAVQWVNAATFGADVIRTGDIPTFQGMRILVNDTLCPGTAVGDNTRYPVYFMTDRNFKLYWQRPLTLMDDKNILYGGGQNYTAAYLHFAPHIDGVSFDVSSKTNPTTEELATSTYWTQVEEDKNIKMVRMLIYREA